MMNLKRVVVIGPECTGKSELSAFLGEQYNTVWVPEYARTYIDGLSRPYAQADLTKIAVGQLELEDEYALRANGILVCDTNLYVIKIWSEFKFGNCDQRIVDLIRARPYDLYLLTYVDIPWENDPQREHPSRREELYSIYLEHMKNQNVPYVEIKGERAERRRLALEAVNKIRA
jgi:NadR type nicotinamide-nucleotide adenylyltransferase